MVHKDSAAISAELKGVTSGKPAYDFVAPDGIKHRFWVISEPRAIDALVKGFAALGVIYIADGHHRSAAAARYAQARRKEVGTKPGAEYERFLAVSFPASEMALGAIRRFPHLNEGSHCPSGLV